MEGEGFFKFSHRSSFSRRSLLSEDLGVQPLWPASVSKGHRWELVPRWPNDPDQGYLDARPGWGTGNGTKGNWRVHPVSSVSHCGRYSPNSLDSVPPTVTEWTVHHDGCYTTAQVIAKGVGEEQDREQNKTLMYAPMVVHEWFSLRKFFGAQDVVSLTQNKTML